MSHDETHRPPQDRPTLGYETKDANPKAIALFGIGLATLLLLVFLAMWGLFVLFDSRAQQAQKAEPGAASEWGKADSRPPEPRLQVSPDADMKQMLEREDHVLKSYGWVNKASGLVRIPVDKAMDIVAAKGLPKLGPIGAPEATPNPFSTPSMATTPVSSGESKQPPAPLGGPPSLKEPVPPPTSTQGVQTPAPNGRNRNP